MNVRPAEQLTPPSSGWRLASSGPRWGLWVLGGLYRVLPLRLGQYLIWGMIWGWFQHFNHPRLSVMLAMARMGAARPYWAAYRVFLNYGFMLVERHYTYAGRVRLEVADDEEARRSGEVMRAAIARPGPLVVLSSHCGAVEHTTFFLEGLGRELRAVALRDHGADMLLSGVGDPSIALGAGRTIIADGSLRAGLTMLKALRSGDILAFKADRALPDAAPQDVLAVPFFGEIARLPLGPARLVTTARARVLVISVFRVGRGRYRALADELDPTGLQPEDIVREYVRLQERHLRDYPEQWFNFYPYWPADEVPVNAIPETVPPSLRGAESAAVATAAAALALPVLGFIFGISEASRVLAGWPGLGAALLLAAFAAAATGAAGARVLAGVPNEAALRGAALGPVLAALLLAVIAPGPLVPALSALALASACGGGLVAWLTRRDRIIGVWVMAILAVINWTL